MSAPNDNQERQADGGMPAAALTVLLQEVRQDVRDGFATLRTEIRSLDHRQTLDRREIDARITKEARRLDQRIDENRSRLDLAEGKASSAGRWWGIASSLAAAFLLWFVTGRL